MDRLSSYGMDRLSRRWYARDKFETSSDREAFEDYFLGALSVLVNDEIWDRALDSARRYAMEAGRKEKEPKVNVEVIS